MKRLVHFAHGNGFPSMCYRQFLTALGEQYDVTYIDKIGHSPQFPVTENWSYLVDEILNSIEQQADRKVVAVGHSLGGVLSLLASIKKPELFDGVILLDAPLLGRFKSSMVRLAKTLGVIDRITPAMRTRSRRDFFKSKEHLYRYLKKKPLFKTFTEACLEDYIDYGLVKTKDGFVLSFDRHIEYLIYRTIPHDLSPYEGKVSVPATLIYGHESNVVDKHDLKHMKKTFGIEAILVEGTHMLPMENPEKLAEVVAQQIEKMLGSVNPFLV